MTELIPYEKGISSEWKEFEIFLTRLIGNGLSSRIGSATNGWWSLTGLSSWVARWLSSHWTLVLVTPPIYYHHGMWLSAYWCKQDQSSLDFFTPCTSLLYQCFSLQMALLGFYHDSSLFTSHVTSIHAGALDDRHCEKERVHIAGVLERIGAL